VGGPGGGGTILAWSTGYTQLDNRLSTCILTGMDELVLLVGLLIAVGSAVASAWFARRNNVRELQEQLDIVSEWAEKAARAARTTRMREVRAAARGSADDAPPELKPAQETLGLPASPAEVKKALRQKFFGRGTPTH